MDHGELMTEEGEFCMVYRLIIARVYHDRFKEFTRLLHEHWAPLFEQHGGKFLGLWKNVEPGTHELVGLMRFESLEHFQKISEELTHDQRFAIVNAKMRPMLVSNEIRLLTPV